MAYSSHYLANSKSLIEVYLSFDHRDCVLRVLSLNKDLHVLLVVLKLPLRRLMVYEQRVNQGNDALPCLEGDEHPNQSYKLKLCLS